MISDGSRAGGTRRLAPGIVRGLLWAILAAAMPWPPARAEAEREPDRLVATHAAAGSAVFLIDGELRRFTVGEFLGTLPVRLVHVTDRDALLGFFPESGAPGERFFIGIGQALPDGPRQIQSPPSPVPVTTSVQRGADDVSGGK